MPVFLYIDAYDSFSNNIVVLLTYLLKASVETIRIDDARFLGQDASLFLEYVRRFDAVIAGPGPGTAEQGGDVGLIAYLWNLGADFVVPVLGICLGFQSLILSHGGTIYRVENPQHGIVAQIVHSNRSIFKGIGDLRATQYNSLAADLGDSRKKLEPLAWHRTSATSPLILSAVRHREKPYWGVQFHPESACTNAAGARLIQNWWNEASEWNRSSRKPTSTCRLAPTIRSERITNSSIDVDVLRNAASSTGGSLLLLESVQRAAKIPIHSETGRFTIAGFSYPDTKRVLYFMNTSRIEVRNGQDEILDQKNQADLWNYLREFMSSVDKPMGGDARSPFWGGLLGFVSYEAALASIDVDGATRPSRPDACFAFVERSVVIDNAENRTWIQSIKPKDEEWIAEIQSAITHSKKKCTDGLENGISLKAVGICSPEKETYIKSIRTCKEEIRAGNSYELCLTAEGLVVSPASVSRSHHVWELYQRLRKLNAAPFAAHLRFGAENGDSSVSVISSSPERFLSWDRHGHCQFRPIKGTLKKTPGMTYEKAEQFFESSKERAENLMIVDLIRHDLNGILRSGEAHVAKLMGVEEYATVYQLVSVVEGDLSSKLDKTGGIDVLAASLPPGSMTGAPKKRSCELLKRIEGNRARGIYSGVIGYLDVGGGGDFSVAIRTAFSWDQERRDGRDFWHIGAGGAITVQSDDHAEYAEMMTKLETVLGIFD
ncbi:para-aminobenzoate synthase [Viridothelium virens]|uniref:aminodeoxychorismate synthase n=1 Tax=Viridothelium virens TaxID=1048519 RepID=A0A6A6H6F5_VIRVR|nr:para-aminobenzoate synthase [Viridothelium virens]